MNALAGKPAIVAKGPKSFQFAVDEEWLALVSEDIYLPTVPIVDSHHHLWDFPDWRYLGADYLKDARNGHPILGTVYVQCGTAYRDTGPKELRPVGETDFIVAHADKLSAAGEMPICSAIVGYANLNFGEAARATLEAHVTAGQGRFRGVRHTTTWDDEPEINPNYQSRPPSLTSPQFQEGLALLARMGLSFDAWIYHTQIPDLIAVARRLPELKIAVNHFGGPLAIGRFAKARNQVFLDWSSAMKTLAACPNVYVKMSGLGMRVLGAAPDKAAEPPSSDEIVALYAPYVDACVDAFGADRCMFASNYPVDKASHSFEVYWNACKKMAAAGTQEERDSLLSGTASHFYRLG